MMLNNRKHGDALHLRSSVGFIDAAVQIKDPAADANAWTVVHVCRFHQGIMQLRSTQQCASIQYEIDKLMRIAQYLNAGKLTLNCSICRVD